VRYSFLGFGFNYACLLIQMPVMDGIEAIQQIRLDPKLTHIPIIA
jgi:CheY-like chemotaxis protein